MRKFKVGEFITTKVSVPIYYYRYYYRGVYGQYQQRPAPAEGGMFKRAECLGAYEAQGVLGG